jgi:large subunit ribosomal protein L2
MKRKKNFWKIFHVVQKKLGCYCRTASLTSMCLDSGVVGRLRRTGLVIRPTKKKKFLKMLVPQRLEGFIKKSFGGRNSLGKTTVRYKRGKKDCFYRPLLTEIVPIFIRLELVILSIFKEDFRSCFLMEVLIKDSSLHSLKGLKGYALAFEGASKGRKILFGPRVPSQTGNRTFLSNIVAGSEVYQIENCSIQPSNIKSKVSFLKSAGSYGTVFSIEKDKVLIRLFKRRQMLHLSKSFVGTIGKSSNLGLKFFNEDTAGYNRNRGIRPSVRGVAKNPVDHPHGGGEGKSSGGRKTAVTPWGRLTKGTKTRNNRKCEKITKI